MFIVLKLTGDKTKKRERIRKCLVLKEHGKKKQDFVFENHLYIQKMLLVLLFCGIVYWGWKINNYSFYKFIKTIVNIK